MTPEQQRIAIAEACGWTVTHWKVNPFDVIATKDGTEYLLKHLPDYLNDLNAMHEAEKVLWDKGLMLEFVNQLVGIVCAAKGFRLDKLATDEVAAYVTVLCLAVQPKPMLHHATAAQRAEAFLRTIGKWEEAL